jgi:hypothetical protein
VVDFLQKVREQMLLMDIDLQVDVRGRGDERAGMGDELASGMAGESGPGCGCGPEGCGTLGG